LLRIDGHLGVREQRGLGAGVIILHVSGNTLDRLAPGEHTFSRDEALSDQAIYVNVCGGQSASAFVTLKRPTSTSASVGLAAPATANAVRSWTNGEGHWMSSPSGVACQVSARGSMGSSSPCTDGF